MPDTVILHPGDVLTCTCCGARSRPLWITGATHREGGPVLLTWDHGPTPRTFVENSILQLTPPWDGRCCWCRDAGLGDEYGTQPPIVTPAAAGGACFYLRDGAATEGCRPTRACWTEACGAAGIARPPEPGVSSVRPAAVYREATATDHALATALAKCTFPAGSASKRFARDLPDILERTGKLTDRQAAFLRRLVTIYRRQIDPVWLPSSEHYLLSYAAVSELRERCAARGAQPEPVVPTSTPTPPPATSRPQLSLF